MVELSNISKLLQQLLSSNNRVSLPGLGAFKVAYTPASFINGGTGMTPPSKHIDFSSAEMWNDHLLENALAKKQGCSLEEAKQQLAEFVEQIERSLAKKQPVVFAGLGVLRLTDDEEYRFKAEKNEQLNSESYGLIEIEMMPQFKVEEKPQQPNLPPIEIFIPPLPEKNPVVIAPLKEHDIEESRPPSYKWLWISLIIMVVLAVDLYFHGPIRTIIEKIYYGEYYDIFINDYKS